MRSQQRKFMEVLMWQIHTNGGHLKHRLHRKPACFTKLRSVDEEQGLIKFLIAYFWAMLDGASFVVLAQIRRIWKTETANALANTARGREIGSSGNCGSTQCHIPNPDPVFSLGLPGSKVVGFDLKLKSSSVLLMHICRVWCSLNLLEIYLPSPIMSNHSRQCGNSMESMEINDTIFRHLLHLGWSMVDPLGSLHAFVDVPSCRKRFPGWRWPMEWD